MHSWSQRGTHYVSGGAVRTWWQQRHNTTTTATLECLPPRVPSWLMIPRPGDQRELVWDVVTITTHLPLLLLLPLPPPLPPPLPLLPPPPIVLLTFPSPLSSLFPYQTFLYSYLIFPSFLSPPPHTLPKPFLLYHHHHYYYYFDNLTYWWWSCVHLRPGMNTILGALPCFTFYHHAFIYIIIIRLGLVNTTQPNLTLGA